MFRGLIYEFRQMFKKMNPKLVNTYPDINAFLDFYILGFLYFGISGQKCLNGIYIQQYFSILYTICPKAGFPRWVCVGVENLS